MEVNEVLEMIEEEFNKDEILKITSGVLDLIPSDMKFFSIAEVTFYYREDDIEIDNDILQDARELAKHGREPAYVVYEDSSQGVVFY